MNRSAIRGSLCGALTIALIALGVAPAHAVKAFKDQFEALYIKPDSTQPAHRALSKAVDAAKCNICHVGMSKKDRNDYGQALSRLISKDKDKDNPKAIREALEKVAAVRSDPKNPKSPTFGELIQQGKLPVPVAE